MELWRRLILLVSVCAAIWLAKFVSLTPLVLVKPVDFQERQRKEGSYMGVRIMTEEKQRLSAMPLQEYMTEVTQGRLIKGEGKAWEELFANIKAITEDKGVSGEWSKRLPSGPYPMKVLFFRIDEPPVRAVSDHFKKANDVAYVSLARAGQTEYLELNYRVYSDDDFHFGSGLTSYPHPPTYLFYPYRKFSLWIALIGLVVYAALPRGKIDPSAIRYPLWRIVLSDILAFIFIGPFFALPILIVGGSTQAFTQGWPALIFFWPFFLAGIGLLVTSAWFASYQILLLEDRLRISTYKGASDFPYSDMSYFQPVIVRSPRWLVFLSWIATFSGKGSSRIGATGRAMILSGSASGSIGIRLRNGADIFVNITDQMGSNALKGFKKILDKLKESGVQEKDEPREIRSLGFETMRIPNR